MQEMRLDGLEARMADMEQDLAAIKAQFLRQIYRKQWYPGLKTGDEAGKDEQLAA